MRVRVSERERESGWVSERMIVKAGGRVSESEREGERVSERVRVKAIESVCETESFWQRCPGGAAPTRTADRCKALESEREHERERASKRMYV